MCACTVFSATTTLTLTLPLNGASLDVKTASFCTCGRQSLPTKLLLTTKVKGLFAVDCPDAVSARARTAASDTTVTAAKRTLQRRAPRRPPELLICYLLWQHYVGSFPLRTYPTPAAKCQAFQA